MWKYFSITIFGLFIMGCANFSYTKEQYIKDFNDFVERVKNEQKSYTEDDWLNADAEFEEYSVTTFEQFESELTNDEITKVNGLKGKYTAFRTVQEVKDMAKEIKQGVDNIKEQAKGFMEGLQEIVKDSSNK